MHLECVCDVSRHLCRCVCLSIMDSSSEPLGGPEDEAACTSASEGLEEGEVEGETLLIVESEDQGSVDLSHDQSGDSLTSDLGEEAEGGWACEDMAFYCERCHKWIPAGNRTNTSRRIMFMAEKSRRFVNVRTLQR